METWLCHVPLDAICLHPLHRKAHVPGLSTYGSHDLIPDNLSSLLAHGYFHIRVYAPATTLGLRSLKSHTASCLHILALHPVPSVCNTFLDFSIGNIPHTFQYGQMSTHSLEALSDALYFQMFMTNGHTLYLYILHTLQFLYLYLMIMSFLVFFSAKLRKKFFFERGDLFLIFEPLISRHNISKSVDIC